MKKFLARMNKRPTEFINYEPSDYVSVGPDADKPLKTNASGTLDSSLLPSIPASKIPSIDLFKLPAALVSNNRVSFGNDISRSANTFATVTGLSFTMAEAGNYIFLASMDVADGGNNGQGEFCLAKGGTAIPNSERTFSSLVDMPAKVFVVESRGPVILFDVISVAANEIVDVRYRSKNGQTVTVRSRNFIWLRVI